MCNMNDANRLFVSTYLPIYVPTKRPLPCVVHFIFAYIIYTGYIRDLSIDYDLSID